MKIVKERKKLILVIGGIALLVVLLLSLYFLLFRKGKREELFDPDSIITESVDTPSEEKPAPYSVPADLPKRIIIPKIGVKGYIQLVSIDQYDRIAVPNNIYLVGWYINSVRPGEKGLSIVSGHKDGRTKPGIFMKLEKLKKGDRITVEYGDDSKREFVVYKTQQVSIEEADTLMYERLKDVEKQLNLITCGGKYSKQIGTYEDRIIVFAGREE